MRRRGHTVWLLVVAGLVMGSLQVVPTAQAVTPADGTGNGHLVERRSTDGRVTFLGSSDGRDLAAPPGPPGPIAAARAHLDSVGGSLGLADPRSQLVSAGTTALGGGRSLVRFDQMVGGRPVFGGQVVVGLAADEALVSVLADVSEARRAVAATVGRAEARRVALAVTRKARAAEIASLRVGPATEIVFDPAVVHLALPGGARPAWQVEVTNGLDVRELVLVDGRSGRALLHFNQVADALNRRVCNNGNVQRSTDVACTSPVRSEGDAAVGDADVDNAYDMSGQTAQAFADIAGIDLTELIGTGTVGSRQLRSTVDWCYTGFDCPYANAFWNGQQMYYGDGYASADDVVAHELTHGVTERTSNLMYFHQSGAMNESFSDIFGEIVDQRNAQSGEAPDTWLLGEDLPGGAIRSMSDPTVYGQPDSMTSNLYTADLDYTDNGGVHTNSGVGNKTFYLVAHGGTLNSVTVTGIDSDAALPKSARLFYEALVSLVSGSEYADMAYVLRQRCAELAAAGTLGFTSANCAQVDKAITATALEQSPAGAAAQPAEAPDTCPSRTIKQVLLDGEANPLVFTGSSSAVWTRAPNASWGLPANAVSGTGSWFAWDPDPGTYGDPSVSYLYLTNPLALPAGQSTYLRFAQWHLFEYDATHTYDGGELRISKVVDAALQPVDLAAYAWDNPPTDTLVSTGKLGFGGDSHGWVTNRIDLTPLGGESIRPLFTVSGDASGSFFGWYLDDIEIYTCKPVVAPGTVGHYQWWVSGNPARPAITLSWSGPAEPGDGVTGYRLMRSGWATPRDIAPSRRSFTFKGLSRKKAYSFSIRPLGVDKVVGPKRDGSVSPIRARLRVSATTIVHGYPVVLRGRVTRYNSLRTTGVRDVCVMYRYATADPWQYYSYKKGAPHNCQSTDRRGFLKQSIWPRKTIYLRWQVDHGTHRFGTVSRAYKVRVVPRS